MRALLLGACLALAGCAGLSARVAGWAWQAEPVAISDPEGLPTAPSRKPDRVARVSKATDTPAVDIYRAIDEWNAALDLFAIAAPRPNIRRATRGHWLLKGGTRSAVAARFDDGSEALYLSQDWLTEGHPLTETMQHEAAHIAAWRLHGEGIAEHGAEWRATCLAAATMRAACRATNTGTEIDR